MIGNLEAKEIEIVLHNQIIGRLGCHANEVTYVVPISYAYDGKYIYAHTHDGMKLRMLRDNPKICFEVEEFENMANWKSVICWGEFEELTDDNERKYAIQKLLDRIMPLISSQTVKITPHWPFYPSDFSDVKGIIFRLKLNEKTGRYEKSDPVPIYGT